jgi:hypothetical protein
MPVTQAYTQAVDYFSGNKTVANAGSVMTPFKKKVKPPDGVLSSVAL